MSRHITLQFCLFFYPQDPNYSISHTIWHCNALIKKNTPKHKKNQIYHQLHFNANIGTITGFKYSMNICLWVKIIFLCKYKLKVQWHLAGANLYLYYNSIKCDSNEIHNQTSHVPSYWWNYINILQIHKHIKYIFISSIGPQINI
jgi:hypothetical protein